MSPCSFCYVRETSKSDPHKSRGVTIRGVTAYKAHETEVAFLMSLLLMHVGISQISL